MKEGLKEKLNNWIKAEQGRMVPIEVLERQVKLWGYKVSNYERRLRPSESPNLERIMKNGAIIGYRWKDEADERVRIWNSQFTLPEVTNKQMQLL